jgi:CHAT domain-containing protein
MTLAPLRLSGSKLVQWSTAGVMAAVFLLAPAWCDAARKQKTEPQGVTIESPEPDSASEGSDGQKTPVMSLEDARRIATEAGQSDAAAPPRTITDIAAVLDGAKQDPPKVAAARQIADRKPDAGLAGADAARFYFERATAESELGRAAQSLADYRKAVELIEPLKGSNVDEYVRNLNGLALAEGRMGHFRDAIKLHEELVAFAEATPKAQGAAFGQYASLISHYVRLGNVAVAKSWLDKLEALMAARRWRGRALARLNLFRSRADEARAAYFDGVGKVVEAEGYHRRAFAENLLAIKDSATWDNPPPPAQFETAGDYIRRYLATNLARQGRMIEAELEVRRAVLDQLKLRGRYANETMNLVAALAFVIAQEGRQAEAEKLNRIVIDSYVGLGHGADSIALNIARQNLAATLVAQQRWSEALAQYDTIRQGVSSDPVMLGRFIGHNLDFAIAAMRAGRIPTALRVTQHALEGRSRTLGDKHFDTAEARGLHAAALVAAGNSTAAVAEFQAAVPILLQASRQIDSDDEGTSRDFRLQRILESYIASLVDARTADSVVEAFRIADAARGRSVQRALAASAARSSVADPALADLVRQEQDVRREVAALNKLAADTLQLAADQQDANAVEAVRQRIDQLRGARATLRQAIEKRFPDYASLINPNPATVADAQKALEPGEALIATYVAEERSYVWAVPKQGPAAFAVVPLTRREVETIVADLRRALDPDASTLDQIPTFDTALAYKLYTLLLKPVEPGLRGAKRLLVVPHGALGELPLSVLVTSPASLDPDKPGEARFSSYRKLAWLARDVAVSELPSVAALTTLRAALAVEVASKPFVGFGDPWFSATQRAEAQSATGAAVATRGTKTAMATRGTPLNRRAAPATERVDKAQLEQLPRLPETADEVREVAQALHADARADVFLGARASEKTVRNMKLDDRRVVMFATHGLVPGDLDGLSEPALALSAPAVAGGVGDGLLTMSKILGLKLKADWVVLSACNTAAGNGAGAEAVSGLGLAFFYAGTRALLVSNWPVETNSARALTTALFRREAEAPGRPRAEALRQAMLALIDGPGYVDPASHRTLFSYAHPIFWAPFSLVGDGGSQRLQ